MEALGLLWECPRAFWGPLWSVWRTLGGHFRVFKTTLGANYADNLYVNIVMPLCFETINIEGPGLPKWARTGPVGGSGRPKRPWTRPVEGSRTAKVTLPRRTVCQRCASVCNPARTRVRSEDKVCVNDHSYD